MRMQANAVRTFLTAACLTAGLSVPAFADLLSTLLPAGIPGTDTQDGVTVASRQHPELQPLGLREGPWQFWPRLDEAVGYSSNALPGPFHRSSWEISTAPSLLITDDSAHDAFAAALALQNTQYLSLPTQSRTDGSASAGWRTDVGPDQLALSVATLSQHEDRGEVGTLLSDRPVRFTAQDATAAYTTSFGRWSLTPGLRLTDWRYDDTTLQGIPTGQAYRDRLEIQASLTLRYEFAPLRNILLVFRALDQDYTRTPSSQPTPDAIGTRFLAGLDDGSDAVWHWRVLLGGETIGYASATYPRQTHLIADAAVGWSPTGLTTVTAAFNRESTQAEQQSVSGLMLTSARLTIDHEYLRNLLFQASAAFQRADFFGGGYQRGTVFSLGATWILNRSARLSATYDQTDLLGTNNPAQGLAGGYSRGLGLLTLRLGL